MNFDSAGKTLVAQRFARSAATYDDAAMVQREMARDLIERLQGAAEGQRFGRVLELGCGTGMLTHLLIRRLAIQHLWLNDLVTDLSAVAGQCRANRPRMRVVLLPGDMETIALPSDQDLVISNAVLQWAGQPQRMLERMLSALRPAGLLALATFGPDNLRETRQLTGTSLAYLPLDTLLAQLQRHATILHGSERVEHMWFDSARTVLRHLKRTGVNALTRGAWTRGALREFCDAYESRFAVDGQVPLTYHPMLIVARRYGD